MEVGVKKAAVKRAAGAKETKLVNVASSRKQEQISPGKLWRGLGIRALK